MTKAPKLGHGKSRLAAGMGAVSALRANRWMQARAFRAAQDRRWNLLVAVTPDRAAAARLPGLGRAGARVGQGGGDLGDRLAHLFGQPWRGPVAVIGVDCPDASAAAIWAAFKALRRAPFALGATSDGGFWIFAARDPRRAVAAFAGVRWSTPHAHADLAARLPGPAAAAPALDDVDTAEDWRRWLHRRAAQTSPKEKGADPAVRAPVT